jgi:NAD(P)-dependent dehydrogenase (short-subunit alcohol dehydrogenase family)
MMHPLFDLSGKSALVTGGSKGIGKAIARGFAEAGADVAICSRHGDELAQAAKEITAGLKSRYVHRVADMTNRGDVDALGKWAVESLGKIDIYVNNAGSNLPQDLLEQSDETWDRIIELNLTTGMRLSRMLAGDMAQRGWGRIIHLSSIMALVSNPGRGAYSATKAALVGMMRAHALELGPRGVTVNCIAPGPIMTDLPMSLLTDEQKKSFAERAALKRWGDPIDMVGPALMLAAEAGRYITGAVVVADGGTICRSF